MAIAALFARQGAQVGVVDISAERAANTVELIESLGGRCLPVVADITQSENCELAVRQVVERFGRLDILVNNAAISGGGGDANTIDEVAWDRVIALDLNAVMLMSKSSVPHLRAAGGGAIVNLSSIAGMRGMGSGAYAAAKGGVIGLTYDLAYSYGRDGIRVNCIAPGISTLPWATKAARSCGTAGVERGCSGPKGPPGTPPGQRCSLRPKSHVGSRE